MEKVEKKDDMIMKILHYFITEEDYKPIILNGVQNEIWLENFEHDIKLIRININYLHNNEQFKSDLFKANAIMRNIKKKTFSFKMNLLNILVDASEYVEVESAKNIESVKINNVTDLKKNGTVTNVFPKIKEKIKNAKSDHIDLFALSNEMNEETIKREKKLARIFKDKKPIVTYVLMAINILVFFMMLDPNMMELFNMYGANNYEYVQIGQIHRLFTAMFLHGDAFHLMFNMYALYILGPQVERYFGRGKYILIYIISGLIGNLLSCVFMAPSTYSIGASSAIFGLLGSICYFSYHYRSTAENLFRGSIMPVIFINLMIGLLLPQIDFFAHLGGLIGGIFISMGIGLGDTYRKNEQINGIVILVILFIFLSYIIYIK